MIVKNIMFRFDLLGRTWRNATGIPEKFSILSVADEDKQIIINILDIVMKDFYMCRQSEEATNTKLGFDNVNVVIPGRCSILYSDNYVGNSLIYLIYSFFIHFWKVTGNLW